LMPPPAFGPGGGMGGMLAKTVLQAADKNKDGKLSKQEFTDAAKKLFTDLDKGKKGNLDEKALIEGVNGLFPPPPGFPGGPGKGGPFGGFGLGTSLAKSLFKRADANKDGKVTLEEFMKAAEVLFKESDKNKDGFLDEKEIADGIN